MATKQKKFIAVIEESQIKNINAIADCLKKEGVRVEQVMSITGIITGKAKDLEKINHVSGIKSVEEDKEKRAL